MEQVGLTGKIVWISPIKNKSAFIREQRVRFELFDSEIKGPFVNLNPDLQNYKRWEPLLKIGNTLTGMRWKNKEKKLITGDSPVRLA